jgi:dTDP-4-dehydrorhamnose reductase
LYNDFIDYSSINNWDTEKFVHKIYSGQDKMSNNDIVVNCMGTIKPRVDELGDLNALVVNSIFPRRLADLCQQYGVKLIHPTTDCVYKGTKGSYDENDEHDITDVYGRTKSLGEPKNCTVIRTSIIGEEVGNGRSLVEWIKSNKDGKINGYVNHYWNGVTCFTLSKIIKEIIKENIFWKGIKHIYSPNTVTKYDLCCYINEIYKLNIKIIPIKNNIEKNMTLTSSKILFNIDNIYNQILEQKNYT